VVIGMAATQFGPIRPESFRWLTPMGHIGRKSGVPIASAGTPIPLRYSFEWTTALAEQSSVIELSFRISANLRRRLSGVTIRHNSGAG
jgi:hypothetical protein